LKDISDLVIIIIAFFTCRGGKQKTVWQR